MSATLRVAGDGPTDFRGADGGAVPLEGTLTDLSGESRPPSTERKGRGRPPKNRQRNRAAREACLWQRNVDNTCSICMRPWCIIVEEGNAAHLRRANRSSAATTTTTGSCREHRVCWTCSLRHFARSDGRCPVCREEISEIHRGSWRGDGQQVPALACPPPQSLFYLGNFILCVLWCAHAVGSRGRLARQDDGVPASTRRDE